MTTGHHAEPDDLASRPDGAQALDAYTGGLARRRDEPPLEVSARRRTRTGA